MQSSLTSLSHCIQYKLYWNCKMLCIAHWSTVHKPVMMTVVLLYKGLKPECMLTANTVHYDHWFFIWFYNVIHLQTLSGESSSHLTSTNIQKSHEFLSWKCSCRFSPSSTLYIVYCITLSEMSAAYSGKNLDNTLTWGPFHCGSVLPLMLWHLNNSKNTSNTLPQCYILTMI